MALARGKWTGAGTMYQKLSSSSTASTSSIATRFIFAFVGVWASLTLLLHGYLRVAEHGKLFHDAKRYDRDRFAEYVIKNVPHFPQYELVEVPANDGSGEIMRGLFARAPIVGKEESGGVPASAFGGIPVDDDEDETSAESASERSVASERTDHSGDVLAEQLVTFSAGAFQGANFTPTSVKATASEVQVSEASNARKRLLVRGSGSLPSRARKEAVRRALKGHTVLLFLGKGTAIHLKLRKIARIAQDVGCNVFVVDYRGFGASDGALPKTSTNAHPYVDRYLNDAVTIARYFEAHGPSLGVDPSKIFVYGHSLGSVAATHVLYTLPELRRRTVGLVLEAGVTSIQRVARDAAPLLNILEVLPCASWGLAMNRLVVQDRLVSFFSRKGAGAKIDGPKSQDQTQEPYVLFLTGSGDKVVRAKNSHDNFVAIQTDRKRIIEFLTTEHNIVGETTLSPSSLALIGEALTQMLPTSIEPAILNREWDLKGEKQHMEPGKEPLLAKPASSIVSSEARAAKISSQPPSCKFGTLSCSIRETASKSITPSRS